MPCRVDDDYNYRPPAPSSLATISLTKYNALKKEADEATKLLCGLIRYLKANQSPSVIAGAFLEVDGLMEWSVHHNKIDRKNTEKDLQKAIKNLSDEQMQNLLHKLQSGSI